MGNDSAHVVNKNHSQKLYLLEVGRAIAAMMVVLHHADQATAHFSSTEQPRLFLWGQYGVDFFFVLSGFIIYHTCRHDPLGVPAARSYAAKRATRIYLPYLPVALAWMILLIIFGTGPIEDRPWSAWATITLLPSDKASALTVAWTLTYEILFYTFFLLFFASRALFRAATCVWAILLIGIATGVLERPSASPLLSVLGNPIVLLFFCGMLAAYAADRTPVSLRVPIIFSGVVWLVAVIFTWNGQRELLGPGLALIVLGAALYETPKLGSWMQYAVFMGAASYAIYLVHSPVISVTAELLQPLENRWLTFAVCAVCGTGLGIAYHILFERPVLRIARGTMRKRATKKTVRA